MSVQLYIVYTDNMHVYFTCVANFIVKHNSLLQLLIKQWLLQQLYTDGIYL